MNFADIPPSTWHELRELALAAGKPHVAEAIEAVLWAPLAYELRRLEPGVWQSVNDYGRPWRFSSPCRGLELLERVLAGERVQLDPGEVEAHRLAAKRALDTLRENGCSRLAAHIAAALSLKRDGRVIFAP